MGALQVYLHLRALCLVLQPFSGPPLQALLQVVQVSEGDNNKLEKKKRFCSTTGKPTHLFRTKCASLDSV
jgi:hypothetical protein